MILNPRVVRSQDHLITITRPTCLESQKRYVLREIHLFRKLLNEILAKVHSSSSNVFKISVLPHIRTQSKITAKDWSYTTLSHHQIKLGFAHIFHYGALLCASFMKQRSEFRGSSINSAFFTPNICADYRHAAGHCVVRRVQGCWRLCCFSVAVLY